MGEHPSAWPPLCRHRHIYGHKHHRPPHNPCFSLRRPGDRLYPQARLVPRHGGSDGSGVMPAATHPAPRAAHKHCVSWMLSQSIPSILTPTWEQTSNEATTRAWALLGSVFIIKKSYTNTYIYIIYIKMWAGGHGWLQGSVPLSALCFLLLGCSVMLALVATSVSQEMPVAEGHLILSERQRAWSNSGQIPPQRSMPQFPHLSEGHHMARPHGDRHLWAEDVPAVVAPGPGL